MITHGWLERSRASILRLVMATGRRTVVGNLVVIDISTSPDRREGTDKVVEALGLIEEYSPDDRAMIDHHLDSIVIYNGTSAHYQSGLRACFMDSGYLRRNPLPRLAMVIVHEATHARLADRGIRYVPEERGRIEEECVAAEIRFAERLPQSAEYVAFARRALDNPWWTEEKLKDRRRKEWVEAFVPKWALALRAKLLQMRKREI